MAKKLPRRRAFHCWHCNANHTSWSYDRVLTERTCDRCGFEYVPPSKRSEEDR